MTLSRYEGWRVVSILSVVAVILSAVAPGAASAEQARPDGTHLRGTGVARAAFVEAGRVVRIAGPTPMVAAALPDPRLVVDATGPGDPYRVHQWGLDAVGEGTLLGGERGTGTTVAVVDSGVDAGRPELAHAVVDGWSVFGDDWGSDTLGHGTGVAGIIAARADDGRGMAGLADGVDLVSVKVVDEEGGAWASDVAEGILWAVDRGVDIINVSLTTDVDAPVLRSAVRTAVEEGVLVVASAGNHGADGNPTMYPAATTGVVGVAALDDTWSPPGFASHGDWVDLAAPGVRVFTTAPGGRHVVVNGASFAAPFVVGALAQLLSVAPDTTEGTISPASAVERLQDAAVDLGPPGWDPRTGAGALDLAAALVGLGARRVPAVDRSNRASALSRAAVGDGRARAAVLVSDAGWADALAATSLAGPDVPLLLAGADGLPSATLGELSRVLPGGSSVMLVGGAAALPAIVEDQLAGHGWTPVRLAGASRVETALAVADSASLADADTVLLASADSWVDAVAGGIVAARLHVPLLLTPGDALHPAVAAHLATRHPRRVVLLGGTAALSAEVEAQVAAAAGVAPSRTAGSDRRATAEAIREQLLSDVAGVTVIDGWGDTGWVSGLASAPLGLPIVLAPGPANTADTARVTRQRVVDAVG